MSPTLGGNMFESCHHRPCERRTAIVYCIFLAVAYVGALYVLVPSNVRNLTRDHHLQIQYRSMASILVSVVALISYPYLFCVSNIEEEPNADNNNQMFSLRQIMFQPYFLTAVLFHTMTLYLGPIVASLVRVFEIRKLSVAQGKAVGSYPMVVFQQLLQPDLHSFLTPDSKDEFWKNTRNYIVAPWTEEVVFRGCMIPPLLASGMSVAKASMVTPLFFGVAHVHHALARLAKGEPLVPVLFITTFQFLYTSLFGMYASYAFIRTGSVLAVTVSHAYCNWMGLPDLSFVQIRHPMYQYRILLLASFLAGVFTFKYLLKSDDLLPLPPRLPTLIVQMTDGQ
ncbi:CAAX protease self-immunity-domain containing protein [Nitzschia inconspicua]|uniref:intramembrane prenyl-peptidase Rce1 n=1 Tax=Nitzschia inconspicua TaxID=303405 RepID=A0A9K3Q0X1_9STRA|nr:CAAX protease self-immunity-domain containing protein [Nitzschia inconspicua]